MGKDRDEAAIAAGKDELRKAGVDVEQNPTDLPMILQRQIGQSRAADLAIAHILGKVATQEAAVVLAELEAGAVKSAEKEVVKAARRALYRLSQRGIAVPDRRMPEERPVHIGLAPNLEGFVSAIDGSGGSIALMARQRPGGTLVLTAMLNEPLGMEHVSLGETTKKQLRSLREQLAKEHDMRLIQVDWHYVDAVCQRAFERARNRGTKGIGDFPTLRKQLTSRAPQQLDQPFVCQLLDCQAVASNPACLARSGNLFSEPEIATWILPSETAEKYGEKLRSLTDSPIVLSRFEKEARAEEIMKECVQEVFSGPAREVYAGRLEEMAYFFLQTERESQAEAAIATAAALRQEEKPGEDIPFCSQLATRTLGFLLMEDKLREQEESKSSVLIRPGDTEAAGSSPLILPGTSARKR